MVTQFQKQVEVIVIMLKKGFNIDDDSLFVFGKMQV